MPVELKVRKARFELPPFVRCANKSEVPRECTGNAVGGGGRRWAFQIFKMQM